MRTASSRITVDGLSVFITKRTGQKRAYLRIKAPGEVSVSCPWGWAARDVERFVRGNRAWIDRHFDLAQQEGAAGPPTSEELARWADTVKQATPELVARWSERMGVHPTRVVFRNMVSRWGSCNVATGRICINVQLGAFPPECLEYVVVHELCHLLERGHGPRFYQLMDQFLPTWRAPRQLLKQQGVRR